MSLSVIEAKQLIDDLKEQEIALGRDPNTWYTYENHVYGAADVAKAIASNIETMDNDAVYVATLLHDICRTEENRVLRFHGILGYEKFIDIDENVARSCILHMFSWNKIPPYEMCSNLFYGNKKDYDFVADYAKNHIPNDIDYLVQLADHMANKNGFVTIEQRAAELAERGRLYDTFISDGNKLKSYFDKKVGKDIYGLFWSEYQ